MGPDFAQLAANLGRNLLEGRLGILTAVLRGRLDQGLKGNPMSPATIFQIHLVLGYVPWLLCFGAYIWPRLKTMDRVEAQRVIATLHSFRFFGLVSPHSLALCGANLPPGFATFRRVR